MHPSVQSLLFGLAGGLIVCLVERMVFPRLAVAQVDLTGLVATHIRQRDLEKLPEAKRVDEAARFAVRLEQETARLAREYRAVLLAAPAVVAGAPDLTAVLRKRSAEPAP